MYLWSFLVPARCVTARLHLHANSYSRSLLLNFQQKMSIFQDVNFRWIGGNKTKWTTFYRVNRNYGSATPIKSKLWEAALTKNWVRSTEAKLCGVRDFYFSNWWALTSAARNMWRFPDFLTLSDGKQRSLELLRTSSSSCTAKKEVFDQLSSAYSATIEVFNITFIQSFCCLIQQ